MAPTDPKRLQVIDRVVAVLSAIDIKEDFFYKPYDVARGHIIFSKMTGFPTYRVHTEPGGEIAYSGDGQYTETFYLMVDGAVRDEAEVVAKLERTIRDVRKAINDDSINPAAGTLMSLSIQVIVDGPPEVGMDNDNDIFFGFFFQKIRVQIEGNFGEL